MIRRLGPRPLPLHLASALTTWLTSRGALQSWRSGSAVSKPHWPLPDMTNGAGQALAAALASHDPKAVDDAVGREVARRLDAFVTGIARYRRHPYRRSLADPPAIWSEGTTRLLDYGAMGGALGGGPRGGRGRPLLVVPSLINRAYILDLAAERSLLRHLAGRFRPFLVDWARPGGRERGLDLSGYVAGRLGAALAQVEAATGEAPVVVGYCMGGLLAAALAVLRPASVAGLVLLATPWDFHADRPELARALARGAELWLPLIERLGELPVDFLQALFFGLDPFLVARKFCAFADLAPEDPRTEEFVALEDWLNDGVPLAAPVARECIAGWYGANTPGRGVWQVAGATIAPAAIRVPTLAVIPAQDRIVPPPSAAALAAAIPGADRLAPPLGHIGMIVSQRARELMWAPLTEWLARLG